MGIEDIRWEQRFQNFKRALSKLSEVVESPTDELSELEKEGMIQRFEYTYELAWKTLQDLLRKKGYHDIAGPSPVLRQSFQDKYLTDNEGWARMKKSRELTSHTYDSQLAASIADDIIHTFYQLLCDLNTRLDLEVGRNDAELSDL